MKSDQKTSQTFLISQSSVNLRFDDSTDVKTPSGAGHTKNGRKNPRLYRGQKFWSYSVGQA